MAAIAWDGRGAGGGQDLEGEVEEGDGNISTPIGGLAQPGRLAYHSSVDCPLCSSFQREAKFFMERIMAHEPALSAPLQTHERWLYGGSGAIAPWIIALVTIDSVQVFRDLDLVVSLFWVAKSIGLFLVGGFVAFLHQKETDVWRCFVTGIAAPALITTALAGQAATRKVSFVPNVTSQAYAASPMEEIAAEATRVEVLQLADIREGFLEKLYRGVLSRNPEMTWLIFSMERDVHAAQRVAATAATFIACTRGRTLSQTAHNPFGDRALVVSDPGRNAHYAIVDVSDPYWREINFASNLLTLYPQAAVSGPRSSFGPRLSLSLREAEIRPVWHRLENELRERPALCRMG
jgi:hypothetical protein